MASIRSNITTINPPSNTNTSNKINQNYCPYSEGKPNSVINKIKMPLRKSSLPWWKWKDWTLWNKKNRRCPMKNGLVYPSSSCKPPKWSTFPSIESVTTNSQILSIQSQKKMTAPALKINFSPSPDPKKEVSASFKTQPASLPPSFNLESFNDLFCLQNNTHLRSWRFNLKRITNPFKK